MLPNNNKIQVDNIVNAYKVFDRYAISKVSYIV